MNQYCVVVANGSRARFYTLEDADNPDIESSPNLVETMDLVNPENIHAGGQWSENKTGRNRTANSGQAHGYDDHRSQHQEEYERRFANSIAEECKRLSTQKKASSVVLVSQKKMLGYLRNAIASRMSHFKPSELAKDLSKLSPHELHEHLAKEKLIPERKSPSY